MAIGATHYQQEVFQQGIIVTGSTTLPACINDAAMATQLSAKWARQEVQVNHSISGTLSTTTSYVGLAMSNNGTPYVRRIRAALMTACTSTDTVTIQVAYYNSGWVNLLSSAISFANTDAAFTYKEGTLTTPTGVSVPDGCPFKWTVTVTGSSAANLVCSMIVDEAANS